MSAQSISGAMDEIVTAFLAVWPNKLVTSNQDHELPSKSVTWARLTLQHMSGEQITLAGNTGKRRFSREGIVTIQVFTPLNSGVKNAYTAAELAMSAFEGVATSSAVWFRNVRLSEVGPDEPTGLWYHINVLADFQYDQIK